VTIAAVTFGDVTFPLTPEKINLSAGAKVQTFNLLTLGEIAFPRGFVPHKATFDGILPGEDRQNLPVITAWQDPYKLAYLLDGYVKAGTAATLFITGLPLFYSMFIATFDWTVQGGFGDLAFKIAFEEKRNLAVIASTAYAPSPGSGRATDTGQPLPFVPSSYVVRQGDTLMTIAIHFYGDSTKTSAIYALNMGTIGGDAAVPLVPGLTLVMPSPS